ncbi:hypothetical protein CDG81_13475 [Actinopolyspora erythraea]|uniref:Immunity protein 63 domain-containing protein n=1 Tax=Actinopolyspora erythraea TaxID=414996 RepID=A0A099D3J7_9ACTN|nr:hypothetical protein CDG81_13475 [Actinopolyspora erythraea]KGI80594.1 hypothetical protein IL38_16320 [Actinopolyspora erythraea]
MANQIVDTALSRVFEVGFESSVRVSVHADLSSISVIDGPTNSYVFFFWWVDQCRQSERSDRICQDIFLTEWRDRFHQFVESIHLGCDVLLQHVACFLKGIDMCGPHRAWLLQAVDQYQAP